MSSRLNLRVDWATHTAALYAVKHWHYSRAMPTPPVVKLGVWENAKYIGCVMFSRGASGNMLKPYGLEASQGCELTRVALTDHETPVSRVISIALKMLKRSNPGLRLVISYADPEHNHVGAIYQAGNWLYLGRTAPTAGYVDELGRKWHSRQVTKTGWSIQYGQRRRCPKISDCDRITLPGKYRYAMPLDREMRDLLISQAKEYPKRPKDSSEPPGDLPGEGGAAPTRALQ